MSVCGRALALLNVAGPALALLLWTAAPAVAWQDAADDGTAEGVDPGLGGGATNPQLEGKTIIRVEEDWLIDIGVTDENSSAPEIVTVFGPSDPNYGLHAVFEMNHSTYPSFVRGGMQIQSWMGNALLNAKRHSNGAELLTTVERIQYTCVTRISYSRTILEIKNGNSVTYGNFGGDGSLRLRLWTSRSNLNTYDPERSIAHSRVTFGANRVNRFLRTEVRYYADDGTVVTDTTDRYVHQLADASEQPINP